MKRSKRWSILPAISIDGYLDWVIYQGSITAEIFLTFVRDQVLPHCTPFHNGGPRSVIVVDNARIHHSQELKDLCDEAGVLLEFLPPYSPDCNPIETSFALVKAWIRRHAELAVEYQESENFEGFLQLAMEAFNEERGNGGCLKLFKLAHVNVDDDVDERDIRDELEALEQIYNR